MAEKMKKRRRPLDGYSRMWLGVIAIGVVSALIGAMLIVKVADIGYRKYTAHFLQAAALKPGNPITVAGTPVGEVLNMKLAGDHVEAKLKVRKNIPLGKDSRAVIKITTILGSRYLALQPAGSESLPDNTFDLDHTEVPYDLQEALADVTTTFEQVDSEKFAQSLGVLGKQMSGLPEVVPRALQNTHTLATIVSDRRDQLGSLLKTTDVVANTLRRQQSTIGNLVDQGNDLVGEFVMRRASFQAMLAALTNLVQTLSGIVIDDRPELEQTLTNLRELSDMLGKHDDLLRSVLQSGPVALRGLANATGNGNAADLNVSNGLLIDSWMCAISGRAKQFNMIQYLKDCK
ncbi:MULTISPECIES: MCE family protein [Mycobacteriaceae]|uniref:Mammalian cell entry protein n=2 Tax=Mycobacteriaceae TaxID=1762 RepID=A0A1Q9W430_9MYCO|nr:MULTISPECIES: MlaD family protein [Mycobacteriaceae]MCG7608017.1 MCE family protein [Mycobacterium sp. CnD-18-1]OHT90858.1 mammalian cell entry protein [Mycobacterium syngnathidarum]OLT88158.1 mammalian cell entry protein [Mycobacterium syngnathidarum]QZH65459.1 MCE family protein [Mycolicibacterium farcinogenes]